MGRLIAAVRGRAARPSRSLVIHGARATHALCKLVVKCRTERGSADRPARRLVA